MTILIIGFVILAGAINTMINVQLIDQQFNALQINTLPIMYNASYIFDENALAFDSY